VAETPCCKLIPVFGLGLNSQPDTQINRGLADLAFDVAFSEEGRGPFRARHVRLIGKMRLWQGLRVNERQLRSGLRRARRSQFLAGPITNLAHRLGVQVFPPSAMPSQVADAFVTVELY
jgi:hypothetical protein